MSNGISLTSRFRKSDKKRVEDVRLSKEEKLNVKSIRSWILEHLSTIVIPESPWRVEHTTGCKDLL